MDKQKFLNKNFAIIVLSVALVLISGVAVGLGISKEEGGQRNECKNGRFFEMGKQVENQNQNDGETQDGQTNELNQANDTDGVIGTSTLILPTEVPATATPIQKTK